MSFLFVDRILELDEQRSRGIKFVTPHDRYLMRNAQQEWIMWPAIIGETLGQMCAWNVMRLLDFKSRPVAGMTGEVQVFGEAKLGDRVELNTDIIQLDSDTVHYHAHAKVNDQVIFSMRDCLGPLLPMTQFIDTDTVRNQFLQLDRPGEGTPQAYQQNLQLNADCVSIIEGYDHILAWQPEQVVALKHISLQASYFQDHFPRKPVFPLTLLLHANMQLADRYIRATLGDAVREGFSYVSLRKIKMSRFVCPGDELVTTMVIKHCDAQRVRMQFRSQVGGKRLAFSTLEFSTTPEPLSE
jgi:3-hydroxymyristoyl/3-hydroxydecanoyl-(acyl carrier protein) dehydratase